MACNFVWPAGMHPGYQKRTESAMGDFLNEVVDNRTLCHEGVAEVSIALSMPLGKQVNAVIVCCCGVPRAALEGQGSDNNSWKFVSLTTT